MKANKLLFLLATLVLLWTCKNKEHVVTEEPLTRKAILVDSMEDYKNSAAVNFRSVEIEGHVMTLRITYSGGCEKHEFSLIGLTSVTKTLPPIRTIVLYHNNNHDSCRQLKSETFEFDISAFGYKSDQEIELQLVGFKDQILYTLK